MYNILITWGSGSRKTNALLNLIDHQPDIDKTYLYAKDPYEVIIYQWLINKREKVGLDHFSDPKSFLNIQMIHKAFIKILETII